MSEAIEHLRKPESQRQLDEDGCEVGVSRQAVDEAVRDFDAIAAENERLRSAIERAGKCLAMSNNGAAEALRILRETKIADQPSVCPRCGGTGGYVTSAPEFKGMEDHGWVPCPRCKADKGTGG